jgi:hypothetical protein
LFISHTLSKKKKLLTNLFDKNICVIFLSTRSSVFKLSTGYRILEPNAKPLSMLLLLFCFCDSNDYETIDIHRKKCAFLKLFNFFSPTVHFKKKKLKKKINTSHTFTQLSRVLIYNMNCTVSSVREVQ